ncbi:hypothetical protein O1611_g2981 [Lasiodiplodia mahajangana]|uniref:Uncharacterized protein n=1 Tax=Lasiodiplodia mahajangana TaxID=1108764 RepID=A0ACC2JTB6_9PEZI|nr:hypothetical protein O1611_g2981 [Lasiodiplodia mahajangana]
MEEFVIDLYEVAGDDVEGKYHTRNDKGKRLPQLLVDDGIKTQIKAKLMTAIPGTLKEGGDPATLLVFEFNLTTFNGNRFKKATITVTFEDDKGPSANDPEVYEFAPAGSFSLNVETDSKDVTHAIDAAVNAMGVDAGYHWTMGQTTKNAHSATLKGMSRRLKTFGEAETVMWVMEEDRIKRVGVPTFLRAAVVLRHDPDAYGEFRFQLEIDALESRNFPFFGRSSLSRMLKPFDLNPQVLASAEKEGVDAKNLGQSIGDTAAENTLWSRELAQQLYSTIGGITEPITSADNNALVKLLHERFPKSHCHTYDPFMSARYLAAAENGTSILEGLGRNLLQDVALCPDCCVTYAGCQERDKETASSYYYRNIIFLGHDLGGSVIKSALILANDGPLYRQIAQATVAIVFFGAIHRPEESFSWERLIINLLAVSRRKLRGVLPNIQSLPVALNTTWQAFLGVSGSYTLFNVYENSDKAVIPKQCASLHSLVTNDFGSQNHHNALLDLQENADPTTEWLFNKLGSLVSDDNSINAEYHEFIRYLTRIEPKLHHLETRSSSPGSLDWITKLESFETWNRASGIRFLHVFGPPGSGVTVLTSNIAWILSEADPEQDICYLSFSFNKQDIRSSSTEKMLEGCTFIIDKFLELRKRAPHSSIKIILTSETQDWAQRYSEFFHDVPMKNVDVGAVLRGIVKDRVKHLVGSRPAWRELDGLITDIFWGEDQNFYLAMAKVDELKTEIPTILSTKAAMMKRLRDFPTETESFFLRMVQKVPQGSPDWLLEAIQWICFALRPLTAQELAVAVAVNEFKLDEATEITLQVFEDSILSDLPGDMNRIAGHWVNVNGGRVEIVNTALRSFLVHKYMSVPSMHAEMLIKCIKYLSWARMNFATKDDNSEAKMSYFEPNIFGYPSCHFLEYAALYWPYHFNIAPELGSSDVNSVQAFLEDPESLNFWSSVVRYYHPVGPSSDFSTSPLTAAAAFGLTPLVEIFLEQLEATDDGMNTITTLIEKAMDLAVEQGHTEIAVKLYTKLQDTGLSPGLHKAAGNGNIDLRQFIILNSVKESINDLDTLGYSPLHYGAQHGNKDAVRILLQVGAHPNLITNDSRKSTALHLTSKIGGLEVAQLLVSYGADHRICDAAGNSPLELACAGGFLDLVDLFLHLHSLEETNDESIERTTTPLHLAATYGHTLTCAYLIERGACIRSLDKDNMSAVHRAVAGNFYDTAEMLVKADPVKTIDILPEGMTTFPQSPLQLAAEKGLVDILKLLLDNSYFYSSSFYDCNEALCRASVGGQTKILDVLLNCNSNSGRNSVNSEGNSALHLACERGRLELVVKLLESGKYDADFQNNAGLASLHLAAQNGHVKIVEALLSKWTTVDCTSSSGDKAIHVAARHGHLAVVKVLQQIKDMSIEQNGAGETPVLIAAVQNHSSIVDELLNSFAPESGRIGDTDGIHELLWGGPYPLHTAVKSSNQDLGRILIHHGYKVNSVNSDGDAPIHVAATNQTGDMIRFLVQNGASLSAKSINGETALYIAVSQENVAVVGAILEAVSREEAMKFIDIPDNNGETPLLVACALASTGIVQLLLDQGSNPNERDAALWSPLHEAAKQNNIGIMTMLFRARANANIRTRNHSTPLSIAAQNGGADAIRLLIDKGANIDAIDKNGYSALHRAVQRRHLDCVELLVSAGANINTRGDTGFTPLHMAIGRDQYDIVNYLLEHGADANSKSELFGSPLVFAMRNFNPKIATLLVKAKATATIQLNQLLNLTKEALLFTLRFPTAFILESRREALQLAISKNNIEAATILVESDIDIDEVGGRYHTALQAAAANGAVELMTKMLQKNANPNILGGEHGSALNAAIAANNAEAVMVLLTNGANPNIAYQDTLLIHHAVKRGSAEIVKLMLDHKTDPNSKDENGHPLLSYAMQFHSSAVVDYLLTRTDISIHDTDLSLRTPLMTAVILDQFHVVKRLLEREANPNVRDSEDKTPLIRAVMSQTPNLEIIQTLLDHHADPSLKDCRGRGALYWTCLRGDPRNIQVVHMLLPFLHKEGKISLHGELVFHAAASLTADTTPSMQQSILDALLLSLRGANFDIAERDEGGWTALYIARQFGLTAIEESLAQAMILSSFGWRAPVPREPTEWHSKDKSPCLDVSENGKTVVVGSAPRDPDNSSQPRGAIRANYPMPGTWTYYFEITIEEDAHDQIIGVGFCDEQAPLNSMIGWDPGSWGYHGDDGNIFATTGHGDFYSDSYGRGDTIGCGVNFAKETAFFTLNGELVGPAFHGIKGKLYPAVSFSTERPVGKITTNFGPDNFRYELWASDKNTEQQSPIGKEARGAEEWPTGREVDEDSDLEWEISRPMENEEVDEDLDLEWETSKPMEDKEVDENLDQEQEARVES